MIEWHIGEVTARSSEGPGPASDLTYAVQWITPEGHIDNAVGIAPPSWARPDPAAEIDLEPFRVGQVVGVIINRAGQDREVFVVGFVGEPFAFAPCDTGGGGT